MDNLNKIKIQTHGETSFEMAEEYYQKYIKGAKYLSSLLFSIAFYARAQGYFALINDEREKIANKRWDECILLANNHKEVN